MLVKTAKKISLNSVKIGGEDAFYGYLDDNYFLILKNNILVFKDKIGFNKRLADEKVDPYMLLPILNCANRVGRSFFFDNENVFYILINGGSLYISCVEESIFTFKK